MGFHGASWTWFLRVEKLQSSFERFGSAWAVRRYGTARKYNLGRRKDVCRYDPYRPAVQGGNEFLGHSVSADCTLLHCSLLHFGGVTRTLVMGTEDGQEGTGRAWATTSVCGRCSGTWWRIEGGPKLRKH